ncbi:Arc family DNA-binding protein [Magnetococcales bacterium HHB-1]
MAVSKRRSSPSSNDLKQIKFRMSVELKKKVEVAAKQNGHSMSAELVARLNRSFGSEEKKPEKVIKTPVSGDNTEVLLQEIQAQLGQLIEIGEVQRTDNQEITRQLRYFSDMTKMMTNLMIQNMQSSNIPNNV